jgi:hypothetical protein
MRGIFYNSVNSVCSIHETGKMCYNVLKESTKYTLDYSEETTFDFTYDFAIVNQHFTVNNWITEDIIKTFNKLTFCIVTEVSLNTNYVIQTSPNFYSHYIVLDPTILETDRIHAFGRPLKNIIIKNKTSSPIPIIGSFGFATVGKEWNKIIECVNNEFDEALIRFNIPKATYVPEAQHNIVIHNIYNNGIKHITKSGIKLELTSFIFSEEELNNWLSENTINCFFYFRQHILSTGLSAVTDQAIVSERPLLVTNDNTFRHIHKYINYYPNIGIKEAIDQTVDGVHKMKQDWSSNNFLLKFETLLYQPKHVLFINHKITNCGVYQYGLRTYNILKKSNQYIYDYYEISNYNEYNFLIKNVPFDSIIYNYHNTTMGWLNSDNIQNIKKNIFIPHESSSDIIHNILDINPNINNTNIRVGLARPLFENFIPLSTHDINNNQIKDFIEYGKHDNIPIIGSFGFGFDFKGFDKIIQLVNDQYEKAIIKFVIPSSHFGDCAGLTADKFTTYLNTINKKESIKLIIVNNFFTDAELLTFLHSNTINIFLYDKLDGRGISSVIDFALSVKKPIAISDSYMFRHIYSDKICLNKTTIQDCINNSCEYLKQFNEKWSNEHFIKIVDNFISII